MYIDIQFALSVIWSRSEYRLTDKTKKLEALGETIIEYFLNETKFQRDELNCPYCYLELRMTGDISEHNLRRINENDVSNHVNAIMSDVSSDVTENNEQEKLDEDHNSTFPAFILKAVLFTVAECQLQNIFDVAVEMFGKVIDVQVDGETEMQLTVGLLKNTLPANRSSKVLVKMDNQEWECKVKGAHSLTDDKLCPRISITYTEFVPYLTPDNMEVINAFFPKTQTGTEEPVEVCVDDYYERLQSIEFEIFSCGSMFISDKGAYVVLISLSAWFMCPDVL